LWLGFGLSSSDIIWVEQVFSIHSPVNELMFGLGL
jgi:hypothetical protein